MPYFLLIFQFFIIIGFFILYLEKKQKIGLIIFCLGLIFLFLRAFFELFGIPYVTIILNLSNIDYIGLLNFFSPMIVNGFFLICGIGFLILHKKSQPQVSELNIAGNMFLFYFIFKFVTSILAYILYYLFYFVSIDVGYSFAVLPVLSLITFAFLVTASIGASRSFIKLKRERIQFPLEPRYSLALDAKNLSLFVLFSFIMSIFFLGIITAVVGSDLIWYAVQFPLISFLIYFSSAGSSFIRGENASKIITTTLIFQAFLSILLGIMLPNVARILELPLYSLSNKLNLTIFINGYITYITFPWLIVFLLKKIEGQNIGKVLKFSFWNFFIFLIFFPETLLISKITGFGPLSSWSFSIHFTFLTFCLSFFLIPFLYMLYIKYKHTLKVHALLEKFSQPILLVGGWITEAFAMTFCIIYLLSLLSILALFYLMIGAGLLLFILIIPPKALNGVIFLSFLDLIFLGIFSAYLNLAILLIGAFIILATLLLSIVMISSNIQLLPIPTQISEGTPPTPERTGPSRPPPYQPRYRFG